ncbi:MAG: MBL fold metallo-hydrolase [Myxococcota bacterium]
MSVTTIDTHYAGRATLAASYLVHEGDQIAVVETNTSLAVPRILAAIEAAGRTTDDVIHVIVTHAHLDHAGGAGLLMEACPNATLHAHPKAARHLVDPTKLVQSSRQVYGDEFDQLYGEVRPVPESRVSIPEDGEQVVFGSHTLTFLYTRGHANHHFVVHDTGSDGVFTGDAFGIVYPVLQAEGQPVFVFPSTTPTDFDEPAAHEAVDRILETGASVAFPTHFGPVTPLRPVADELHRLLTAHCALVDEADGANVPDAELDGWFATRVAALFDVELTRHGKQDDAAARSWVAFDVELNAQGLAFAVRKRRFKRGR